MSTLTLNATHSASSFGFQPKVVLVWLTGRSETTDTIGTASHDKSVGFCHDAGGASGAVTQRTLTTQSLTGNTTMGADFAVRDDCIVALLNHSTTGGTDNGRIKISSFDAGGFTVQNLTALSRAVRLSYVALGGSDLTNYEIGTITEPAATGNQTVTMTGAFAPDALIFLGSLGTSINAVGVDSALSIGAATSSAAANQWVLAGGSDDAVGTSTTWNYIKGGECIALAQATPGSTPGTTTLNGRASLGSVSSGSFVLNWSERASTRLVFYLALKGGQWKAGKKVFTNTANGNTNVVTGVGFQPTVILGATAIDVTENTADTPVDGDQFAIGAATGSANEHCQYSNDLDAQATGGVRTGITTSSFLRMGDGTTVFGSADLTSFDVDGFTMTNDNAFDAAGLMGYLVAADAVGGGGGFTPRQRKTLGASGTHVGGRQRRL